MKNIFLFISVILLISFSVKAQTKIDSTSIYFNQSKYDKALKFSSKSGDYYQLNENGNRLFQEKIYSNSLLFYLKAEEIGKKYFDEKFYLSLLELIGFNYQYIGDIDKAVVYFESAYLLNSKINSEFDDSNLQYLANLIVNYNSSNNYKKSCEYYLKVLKIQENKFGINHPNYVKSLNNLAYLYNLDGKYLEAETLYLKIIEVRKITLGERHPDYALSLSNLACLYDDEGKYNLAEQFHLKSLEIRKDLFGEKEPEYLISLNNLANSYLLQSKYSQAEPLFLKVIKIRKETIGEDNIDYAISLNNLAVLYVNQGIYYQAEPLYIKALEIKKELLGEKHPDYALALNNLANLYDKQGQYSSAEPLYIIALDIRKEILGEKHPDYADSLNNLAGLYQAQGKYSQAESLFKEALEIREEVLGEKHPDYATSLDILAGLYRDQEKYLDAEPLFLKALEIRKELLGEKHPDYALSLNNLALLYELQDKHSKAEPLFLKSLEIRKESLGKNHPDYISNLFELAHFYRIIELNEKSAIYFEEYMDFNHNRMIDDIYSLSEKDLINYVDINKKMLFSPLSFLNDFPTHYPKINNSCYENELLVKNLSLKNQQLIQKTIQKNGNKALQIKYEQFLKNKREITKLQELTIEKRPSNLEMLTTYCGKLEKELIKESTTFFEYKKLLSFKWNNIKDKLKDNEASIDLVSFTYHKKDILYAAFVVKKGFTTPKFISLFEEKQLEFLLGRNKVQHDSSRIDKQYMDKAISDLFFKPLEKEFQGITTIYLSPTGLGHQIDFAALPVSGNQTLGEKYNLHILSSPAELLDYKVSSFDKKSNVELLLYGGIDYNKSTPKAEIDKEIVEHTNDITALRTQSGISGFDYLNGTNNEVDQIQLKGSQNGFTTTIFKESEATEESIKALDGKTTPYLLHLATHGFFFPDPKQEIPNDIFTEQGKSKIYKASDDPMMRSGLLLAGANNYWGKSTGNTTIEDGILTASEISNLDLSACQLVVLSACETGLGEINGSEGVFGLQRAFKMAGVKNIIMSLWKVPDAQTAVLFDIFYSECFAGKTIHEAFQSAQAKMKVKYSPYYWAGFVLLE